MIEGNDRNVMKASKVAWRGVISEEIGEKSGGRRKYEEENISESGGII